MINYNWNLGSSSSIYTVNTPGSYYVTCISQNGLSCQSEPVNIFQGNIPINLSTPDSIYICQGDTVIIEGPTGFAQYNWNTGATSSNIITDSTGNYNLSVVDANGCTGTSNTHVTAIVSSIRKHVSKELKEKPFSIEGNENQEWVLIDYVDVVVHVFQREIREYYDIENLWGDAKITNVELNA